MQLKYRLRHNRFFYRGVTIISVHHPPPPTHTHTHSMKPWYAYIGHASIDWTKEIVVEVRCESTPGIYKCLCCVQKEMRPHL